LIEAPNESCVKDVHDNAHGLIPHQIIEVDKNVVNAFLGRIEDPDSTNLLENSSIPIHRTLNTISCFLISTPFLKYIESLFLFDLKLYIYIYKYLIISNILILTLNAETY
jgi:hypothetical protein